VTRRRLLIAGAAAVLVLAAVPLTAYVVVPQFVRSTVVEKAPVAAASPGPTIAAGSGPPAEATAPAVTADAVTVSSGDLRQINAVDFGRGRVLLLKVGEKHFLRFENVEIAAAPAQHVYLSDRTDGKPGNFTDLGSLKATSGSFNYEVPATVDVDSIGSVVSWCKQFNSTVTYAVMQHE
jgi:hypothetical protein